MTGVRTRKQNIRSLRLKHLNKPTSRKGKRGGRL